LAGRCAPGGLELHAVPVDLKAAQWLVVVTGWTGAGKSTIAERLGHELGATVASFDWLMSGLRAVPEVWAHVEVPVERQRRVGWHLLSRVAEQQLRRGSSCVLDLVARAEPVNEWRQLAALHGARFAVIECVCSDVDVHRGRVDGRQRGIPGWYELEWERVERGRQLYEPLPGPKVVIDATESVDANLDRVRYHLLDAD
jgi:predicted kinase